MPIQATDSGLLSIEPEKVGLIAVNTLDVLGWKISRHSRQLNRLVATDCAVSHHGRLTFRSDWMLVITWQPASQNRSLIKAVVTDNLDNATKDECFKRCEQVLIALEADVERFKQIDKVREKSKLYGDASWATDDDLRKSRFIIKNPAPTNTLLAKHPDGFIALPEQETYKHLIVAGRTGVGKTTGFFLPNLLERTGTSMIVTEATPGWEEGEIYRLTSGWRKQAGNEIYCFNPAFSDSIRINPLDMVRTAPAHLMHTQVEKLTELIMRNSSRGGESRGDSAVWENSERQILNALILHLAESQPEFAHIGAMRWLLRKGADGLKSVFAKSRSPYAQEEFETWFNTTEERIRQGVLFGLMGRLNAWFSDHMIALTSETDIKIDDLKSKLFTFYIAVPVKGRTAKLMASLVFNYLLELVESERNSFKYPLCLFLDEFTNFGYIDGMAELLSIIRKSKIGVVLGFQDYRQLQKVYGQSDADIILGQPGTHVYFRQKGFHEARALSDSLGRMTVENVEVSDSGRVSVQLIGQNLMTVDQLTTSFPKDEVIILTDDTPPIRTKKFGHEDYSVPISYPPPERKERALPDFLVQRRNHRQKAETTNSRDTADVGLEREPSRAPTKPQSSAPKKREAPDAGRDVWSP
jgi:type IV secretion system protein VirD4